MGVCVSTKLQSGGTSCTLQCTVKLGKKQTEIEDWVETNRGQVDHRVTELYEAALQNPLSVTTINLNLIRLDSAGCQRLATIFPFCSNIVSLKLWKCKIGAKGAKILADTLREVEQLQVLGLADNALGIEGAEQLANSMPFLLHLRELNCQRNNLQCEGVRLLTERMGCLEDLTILILDDNDMTSYGLNHLLYNLHLSNLERLGLSYDRITDCGVQSLIKYAGALQNLDILDFKGNLVSMLAAEKLLRVFPEVKVQ